MSVDSVTKCMRLPTSMNVVWSTVTNAVTDGVNWLVEYADGYPVSGVVVGNLMDDVECCITLPFNID